MNTRTPRRRTNAHAGDTAVRTASWLALLCGALLLAGGCLDGKEVEPPAVNLTGTWTVSLAGVGTERLVLNQDGSSLQGNDGRGNPLAGSVEGDRFGLTIAQRGSDNYVELVGIASESTMSGDYIRGIGDTRNRGSFIGARRP